MASSAKLADPSRMMIRAGVFGAVALAVSVPGGAAYAQDEPGTPPTIIDDSHMPRQPFALLDRADGTTTGTVESAVLYIPDDDLFGLRVGLHYQVTTASGAGGYVNIPFTVFTDGDNSEAGIGNLSVGGSYAARQDTAGFAVSGGLVLPTNNEDGFITNIIGAYARPGDLVLAAPEGVWVRTGASGLLYLPSVMVRADLGVDVPIDVDGAENLVRFGVGVTGRPANGGVSWAVELATVSGGGSSLKTLAVGATWGRGHWVGTVIPLNEGPRGELFILGVSLRAEGL